MAVPGCQHAFSFLKCPGFSTALISAMVGHLRTVSLCVCQLYPAFGSLLLELSVESVVGTRLFASDTVVGLVMDFAQCCLMVYPCVIFISRTSRFSFRFETK